jgi:membrane fusion protein (multidrug efflux system)
LQRFRIVRYAVAALVVLLLLGALAATKWSQIATLMAAGQEAQRRGPPAEAVGTSVLEQQEWETTLDGVGTVASNEDVAIRTEVTGVVRRVVFESGSHARAGEVLVQLDASVEQADLEAALATERLTSATAVRTRTLVERGAETQAELDRVEADHDAAIARVSGIRALIAKKTIRAPFAGMLGIRGVNVGQLVEAGTTITTLGGEGGTFVDFTLPQSDLGQLSEGMPVRVALAGEERTGTLVAIEPAVRAGTRAVGLRAVVEDHDELLRPGMFVDVHVILPQRDAIIAVPATAIVHAAYGDSVFVVEDRAPDAPGASETPDGHPIRVARQTFVRTAGRHGDFVAVREGVEAGREIVSTGAFKLRNGSPVFVAPPSELRAELEPHPRGQ